jgi:hypothetical protein
MGFAGEDARDPTDSNTTTNLTHCSGQIKTSGGTNGLNHLKSFDTNGFTLYQDQASADAIICPYLAIVAADIAGGGLIGDGTLVGDSVLVGKSALVG